MPRNGRVDAPLVPVAFGDMIAEARRQPLPATGCLTERCGEPGSWAGFEGWRFLHWFEGNPDARRIHLVNRAIDRPEGSDLNMQSPDADYVDWAANKNFEFLKFSSLHSNSRELELSNFLGLVLGCIEAKFCK